MPPGNLCEGVQGGIQEWQETWSPPQSPPRNPSSEPGTWPASKKKLGPGCRRGSFMGAASSVWALPTAQGPPKARQGDAEDGPSQQGEAPSDDDGGGRRAGRPDGNLRPPQASAVELCVRASGVTETGFCPERGVRGPGGAFPFLFPRPHTGLAPCRKLSQTAGAKAAPPPVPHYLWDAGALKPTFSSIPAVSPNSPGKGAQRRPQRSVDTAIPGGRV